MLPDSASMLIKDLALLALGFTGPESTVSTSFIIGISLMHAVHLLAGVIVLFVVIYNHFKYKYKCIC